MNKELRSAPQAELRAEGEEGRTLAGYAAMFDTETEIYTPFGSFREVVAPGAFARSIERGDDVVAWFNHGDNPMPLGRTAAGTLRVAEDSRGLAFEIDLPDTQLGRDVAIGVRRGDIRGMSFAFTVPENGDEWRDNDGTPTRVLRNVNLMDVSPVVWPAYPTTSVAVRSADEVLREHLEASAVQEQAEEPTLPVDHGIEPYELEVELYTKET